MTRENSSGGFHRRDVKEGPNWLIVIHMTMADPVLHLKGVSMLSDWMPLTNRSAAANLKGLPWN